MAASTFKRLVRFIPKSDSSKVLLGEPNDEQLDIGLAVYEGHEVTVNVFSGSSALHAGQPTGRTEAIGRLLSPVTQQEAGAIRCIGLNYKQHAAEVNLPLPAVPTLFLKPETTLADPWPTPCLLPKLTQQDDCGDYEAELAIIIGKECKNVPEDEAMEYVLGYTAANDVSSRTSQFEQSQWCFSKGFDGSCPLGPVLVSPSLIPDPQKLHVRGLKNGELMQDCGTDDFIFSAGKLISFLSQGTTLKPGTVIITGTPAGVGLAKKPKVTVRAGDQFIVQIEPRIGSLITEFVNE